MGLVENVSVGGAPKSRWSDIYRGTEIGAVRDDHGWMIFLGEVVERDRQFETLEEAAAWLRRTIDARIAESIFPGLGSR